MIKRKITIAHNVRRYATYEIFVPDEAAREEGDAAGNDE